MELEDVFKEIERAAEDLALVAPGVGSSKGKAYEVWVLLEIAVRLARKGVWVLPRDHRDQVERSFRVRGGPGNMPSAVSSSSNEPCHFAFGRGSKWFELHLGLQQQGVSPATHELDLCVLPIEEGQARRSNGAAPYLGSIQLGLELKAYAAKHKLDHSIPRALIGVAVDLDPTWAMSSITVRTPGGRR